MKTNPMRLEIITAACCPMWDDDLVSTGKCFDCIWCKDALFEGDSEIDCLYGQVEIPRWDFIKKPLDKSQVFDRKLGEIQKSGPLSKMIEKFRK